LNCFHSLPYQISSMSRQEDKLSRALGCACLGRTIDPSSRLTSRRRGACAGYVNSSLGYLRTPCENEERRENRGETEEARRRSRKQRKESYLSVAACTTCAVYTASQTTRAPLPSGPACMHRPAAFLNMQAEQSTTEKVARPFPLLAHSLNINHQA
jgi:hypothetical protein